MHLTILTHNKCNLHCDFCSNEALMYDDSKPRKDLDVLLEQHLKEHGEKYHMFHLSGGEPTMNAGLLENILSVLLSHSEEKIIHLYTNGSYLNAEMVDVINQYPNIVVNVSIDRLLEDERGFFKLLDNDYREGYGTLHCILGLRNLMIRVVAPRQLFRSFTLAAELSMLQRYFDCPVLIDMDKRTENLNAFGMDDAYYVGETILRLTTLGSYSEGKVMFNKFFESPCQNECGESMKWTGEILTGCQLSSEQGCESLRRKMIPGMYDLVSQLVNYPSFTGETKLHDQPQYDDRVGYQGTREELTPLRKQLQYEERVNVRFKKKETEILFKEVK